MLLHLGVQVRAGMTFGMSTLIAVFLHFPKGVEEEQHQNGNQDIEVVDELILQSLEETRLEHLVPSTGRDEWDEQEDQGGNFSVEESGDQSPMQTHDDKL